MAGRGPARSATAAGGRLATVLLSLASVWRFGVAHAETAIPAAPTAWVTDRAALLSAAARAELDGRLAAYARANGHQVLVYVDRSTGGVPIEDWAVRAFERWRAGRSGIDDGVVLFLFTDDRRIRIEVGYGLEGALPDALAGRIVATEIAPRMRAGDADGAVRAGVNGILTALGDAAARDRSPLPTEVPWPAVIVVGILLVFFAGLAVRHPRLALWILWSIAARGRGAGSGPWGGGRRGGGGFSGGGGRSGGGGASGSW